MFLADVVTNKLKFYAKFDELPKHFLTTLHDNDDIISIYGDNKDYRFAGGKWFIQLSPDYALADMFKSRDYIYNMLAFSMAPQSFSDSIKDYDILQLDKKVFGFSNQSSYQDYRFFQVDMAAEYLIELIRLPNRGSPVFYVKIQDSENS